MLDGAMASAPAFETKIWHDLREVPAQLRATLDRAEELSRVAAVLSGSGVRRIVAVGNGAAYYVAHLLWLASLEGPPGAAELVAVPSGLVAKDGFQWRSGDLLLAVSSSGEFRDLVEATASRRTPRPYVAITADAGSTLGRGAAARALVSASQQAPTHTQAFLGGVVAALAIWAEVTDDVELRAAVSQAPEACARAITASERWAQETLSELAIPTAAVAFGSGSAWAAALEAALLIKEVARIPSEGVETREGSTSAMMGLAPGHLVLSLATRDDSLVDEAERVCASLGAAVLQIPGGQDADARLSPVTTFPAALAVAVTLGVRSGLDVDKPDWIDAYYATARQSAAATE
jgi:glutamine---fructose-6-phosphate transaminase (isomerizing)